MGINEQIKAAKTENEIRNLSTTYQPMASQKTLRRRAKLVQRGLKRVVTSK